MEENRINSVGETADTIGGGENLETPHKPEPDRCG